MRDNRLLPVWLDSEVKLNVIHLKGIPRKEDIGDYKIRIINSAGYIIRDFDINVENACENEASLEQN